ncbi:SGNH/GDSL hydrolase family protein [Metamycoplasma hyosynoviae]|uniref:SGNH/GDSL hydrolase family protein n=1 Tax=Metamycoplasma hyosynoviae TaxID=29559 RepID=UPI00236207F9|nr:SGNH/GDSL hydrolase family protein [Metamycoplasma hyosynoviae]MDD1378089.1 SGNH/GDSL hydrolase family protein [Metamycoplasma hyosynoviae]
MHQIPQKKKINVKKALIISTSTILGATAISLGSFGIAIAASKKKIQKNKNINLNINNTKIEQKLAPNIINLDEKVRYLALGDSISAGFTAMLSQDHPGAFDANTNKFSGTSFPVYLAKFINKMQGGNKLEWFENHSVSGGRTYELIKLFGWQYASSIGIPPDDEINHRWGSEKPYPKPEVVKENIYNGIKKANLITLTFGANDAMEVIKHLFKQEPYSSMFSNLSFDKIGTLASNILNLLENTINEVKARYITLVNEIKKINPNANIVLVSYPMPFNRLTRVIDSLLLNVKGISTTAIDILNVQIIKSVSLATKTLYVNIYDKEYWNYEQSRLTEVITDIHPTVLGWKKMAMDAYIKLTTGHSSFDKYKDLNLTWNSSFVVDNEQYKVIDTLESTENLVKQGFYEWKDEWNNKKYSKYEDFLYDLDNDDIYKNIKDDYKIENVGKRISKEMMETIVDKGILENLTSDSFLKDFVDLDTLTAVLYKTTNNVKNYEILRKMLVKGNLGINLINELQRYFSKEDFDKDGKPGGRYIEKDMFIERLVLTFINPKIIHTDLIKPFISSDLFKNNKADWIKIIVSIFDKYNKNNKIDSIIDLIFDYGYDKNTKTTFLSEKDAKNFFLDILKNRKLNEIYKFLVKIVLENSENTIIKDNDSYKTAIRLWLTTNPQDKDKLMKLIVDMVKSFANDTGKEENERKSTQFRKHFLEKLINLKAKYKTTFKDKHNMISEDKANIDLIRGKSIETFKIIAESADIQSKIAESIYNTIIADNNNDELSLDYLFNHYDFFDNFTEAQREQIKKAKPIKDDKDKK